MLAQYQRMLCLLSLRRDTNPIPHLTSSKWDKIVRAGGVFIRCNSRTDRLSVAERLRQSEKRGGQTLARARREPICKSAAQLFMGERNKVARMRPNSLSFRNSLRIRPPPRDFYFHCAAGRWVAVGSRVCSVLFESEQWLQCSFTLAVCEQSRRAVKTSSQRFNRLLWLDFQIAAGCRR